MTDLTQRYPYPRRQFIRRILRSLAHVALHTITDFKVTGRENLPKSGPLLVVGNHFSFIDPVAMMHIAPWPIEFIGGLQMPNAPKIVTWLPGIWGYFPVYRGSSSHDAIKAAETILRQKGVLGIFPEGGSWATVLRPPRPGTAYLATRTGAQILPIGLDGFPEVFPSIRKGKRPTVRVRIGKPFGPFEANGRGRARREKLDEIGHTIMTHIRDLIPAHQQGYYSDDPAIREVAKGTEIFPWDVDESLRGS